jgi:hypothetical protein
VTARRPSRIGTRVGDEAGGWAATLAAFEDCAGRMREVVADPLVERAWHRASMLPRLTVGGVVGHVYAVLRTFERRCDTPAACGSVVVDPAEGYALVHRGRDADLQQPPFSTVWVGAEGVAARGHASLVAGIDAAVARLLARLPDDDGERLIGLPDASQATTLHRYTETRVVELVVHAGDLADSVGCDAGIVSPRTAALVEDFLLRAVRHRIGDGLLVRALAGRTDADVLRAL